MIDRQTALIKGDWHDIRLEGWVVEGYDRLFQEPGDAEAASKQSGRTAVPVFTVHLQENNGHHAFVQHAKYPWFCKYCGYAPHEPLMHFQADEVRG